MRLPIHLGVRSARISWPGDEVTERVSARGAAGRPERQSPIAQQAMMSCGSEQLSAQLPDASIWRWAAAGADAMAP